MNRMKKIILTAAMAVMTVAGTITPAFAQRYSADSYKHALWMATRFYGGQRSGAGPNWLIMEHPNPNYRDSYTLDNDNGRDVSGGWFDCGDHILYSQTFFFSVYVLALGYESFPLGFHDLYHGDYSDYMAATGTDSARWSMASGRPNGIPDMLEELRYATDWIIKAVPDANTFIYQVGDNRHHHQPWATSGFQSFNLQPHPNWNGGNPRPVYKNPNDKPMPSLAAAALAVMSRIYRNIDPTYSALLLQHAQYAYEYAARQTGAVPGRDGDGNPANYPAHKHPATVFVTAAAEMYLTTGDERYLNAIVRNDVRDHEHVFDYSNTHDLAAYAAARAAGKAGNTADRQHYLDFMRTTFLNKYMNSRGGSAEQGIVNLGGGWGEMRYPANAAFIAALYQLETGGNEFDDFIHRQIDFILGDNASNISFLVGFTERPTGSNANIQSVLKPHHRNVFLRDFTDWGEYNSQISSMRVPPRNRYFGYMAGGRRNTSDFNVANTSDYTATEGGIDYQAGFVGALAYIVSNLAPFEPGDPICPGNTIVVDGKCVPICDASQILVDNQCVSRCEEDEVWDGETCTTVSIRHARNRNVRNGLSHQIRAGSIVFTSHGDANISNVSLYNLQGRRVYNNRAVGARTVNISTQGRPRGVYVAQVEMSNGVVLNRNLLVR